jgi:hypothetical protein
MLCLEYQNTESKKMLNILIDKCGNSYPNFEADIMRYLLNTINQNPYYKIGILVMPMLNRSMPLYEYLRNANHTVKIERKAQLVSNVVNLLLFMKTIHMDLHLNNALRVADEVYLIDFGRAIYKYNGNLFCSDSFQTGEDAATQYNTEPYFNDKKPRLEPNFSFDLCRLACSIFDYVVDDFDNLKQLQEINPVVKLIIEWCLDDNGINVLYKNNGVERYPDFKLYKMISRCVHNHLPSLQLERPEFKKYLISKINLPKDSNIINIDELN